MIKSLIPLFSKPTSLLSSPSCLWLCLFCPYFYSWTRQAFSQSHGVFLSYSRLQRGYHCYSPDTHRYFVSADVTFFENSSIYPINHPPNSDVYLYPFFISSRIPHLYLRLLHLNHCRFILVARVLTSGLRLTHLLWHPPP